LYQISGKVYRHSISDTYRKSIDRHSIPDIWKKLHTLDIRYLEEIIDKHQISGEICRHSIPDIWRKLQTLDIRYLEEFYRHLIPDIWRKSIDTRYQILGEKL